jgi:hypothetical protein
MIDPDVGRGVDLNPVTVVFSAVSNRITFSPPVSVNHTHVAAMSKS